MTITTAIITAVGVVVAVALLVACFRFVQFVVAAAAFGLLCLSVIASLFERK